jgi:hypothetical protein
VASSPSAYRTRALARTIEPGSDTALACVASSARSSATMRSTSPTLRDFFERSLSIE